MHRFMASPLVPSFSAANGGLSLSHAHLVHLTNSWSATITQQLHVPKIIDFVRKSISKGQETLCLTSIRRHLHDIISFGVATEFSITPESILLVEMFNIRKGNRGKAVYYHKLPEQNLTVEAAWPGLFLDDNGTYWDVPVSFSADLASLGSESGLSYHLCLQHNRGQPRCFVRENEAGNIPASLLPGTCIKAAVSLKKSVDFWKTKGPKLKLVQPYDLFLCEPHVTGSAIIGAVVNASAGDCSTRLPVHDVQQRFNTIRVPAQSDNYAFFADLFGSVTCSAQHGNFQKLILDLSKVSTRLDFSSGTRVLMAGARLAQDFFYSRKPNLETLQAVCPDVTVSLQQQIIGPFSFRVDSKVVISPQEKGPLVRIREPIFAIDWALQVLGSAKATAWYSPQHQEAMIELRFFEC